MSFDHLAVQSGLMPLVLAFALTGLLRLVAGPGRGSRIAGAAIPAATLAAAIAILGVPAWPPASGLAKWPLVVAACLGVGLALDLGRPSPGRQGIAALACLSIALAWIAWPSLGSRQGAALAGPIGFAIVCGLIVWRMAQTTELGSNQVVMLIAASLGLAGVALGSASLALAQLAGALAAAAAGFALWNWPVQRFTFAASGLLGTLTPFACLAALTLLLTEAKPWSLALLVPVFFADRLSRRIPAPAGPVGPALRSVYLFLVALIPAAAAVAVAHVGGGGGDDTLYYR